MTLFAAAVILFIASLIRSTFGFGKALFAVPLLSLLMPVEAAAPAAVLASLLVAAVALLQDWRHVHLGNALSLLLPTLVGIPLGLLLLTRAPEPLVKGILGALIMAFSAFVLLSRQRYELKTDRSAWFFGFIAGILGGAYGMNGPPLFIYGALRRWTPQHFRATLQAYFIVASAAGMAGYGFSGLWTAQVNQVVLWSSPGIILATLAGGYLNRRIHPQRFASMVHAGLLLVGAVLLVQALR